MHCGGVKYSKIAQLIIAFGLITSACSDEAGPNHADAPFDVGVEGIEDIRDADKARDIEGDSFVDPPDGQDVASTPASNPSWPFNAVLRAIPLGPTSVRLEWTPAQDDSQIVAYELFKDGVQLGRTHGHAFSYQVGGLDSLQMYTFEVAARDDENNLSATTLSTDFKLDIPEPSDVAQPPSLARASTPYERTRALFTGDDPLQRDVVPGSITERRVARLTGKVVDEAGQPIAGVHISVHDQPDWGYTLTRPSGEFDLAVNGGGRVTVAYRKGGYLPVHRRMRPRWQSSERVAKVVMLGEQANPTTIDPSLDAIARGDVVDSMRGTRQTTIIFHAGTTAEMVLPDGSRQALNSLDVRISEYTVGEDGPNRMPADLPPNVAYTYAAEISVDEATAAGAMTVEFSQPVAYYVENFLGFDTGTPVPLGLYDMEQALWIPTKSGRVVEVLSVDSEGRAEIDVDGSGNPADAATLAAMEFTDAEREKVAEIYAPGQTLSRVLLEHFSTPDCNGSPMCNEATGDCVPPDVTLQDTDDCNQTSGSIIGCESQSLGESVPLTGVPFGLHYSTRYQFGYAAKRHGLVDMFKEGDEPNGLLGMQKKLVVEGIEIPLQPRGSNLGLLEYLWDGHGRDGERVLGGIKSETSIGFCYELIYMMGRFGSASSGVRTSVRAGGGGVGVIPGQQPEWSFCLYDELGRAAIEGWSVPQKQMGGWTMGIHHYFDPFAQIVYRGDGTRRRLDGYGETIETHAGTRDNSAPRGESGVLATSTGIYDPKGFDFASDGSLYFATNNYVFRVDTDGILTRVAGSRADTWGGSTSQGFYGDGGPANESLLDEPTDVAVGPDDSVYIADTKNHRIRKIVARGRPVDGTERIITVAGSGSADAGAFGGDGGPAIQARLDQPHGIDVDDGGSLYIADTENHRIRQVTADGRIETVAGSSSVEANGTVQYGGFTGDGGSSLLAELNRPIGVVAGRNNTLYILDKSNDRVRKIDGGVIETVAGYNDYQGDHGDGIATEIDLDTPESIALGDDGTLFIGERDRIHAVRDGLIKVVVGGIRGDDGDGHLARATKVNRVTGLMISPNGLLFFSDQGNKLIRKVVKAFADPIGGSYQVPSRNGSQIFVFDTYGSHLQTLDARSGNIVYEFSYENDLLSTVTDEFGHATQIERDGRTGLPTAIIAPYGQRTELEVFGLGNGRDGFLKAVTNPAGDSYQLDYYQYGDGAPNACPDEPTDSDLPCCLDDGSNCHGLLKTFVEPMGSTHIMSYDRLGRLTRDEGPNGFSKTLTRIESSDSVDFSVDITTTRQAADSFEVEHLDDDVVRRTHTYPTGEKRVDTFDESKNSSMLPDGSTVEAQLAADPRFGMHAPYAKSVTSMTPSGKTMVVNNSVEVTLADEDDFMSIERHHTSTSIAGDTFESVWTLDPSDDSKTVVTTTPEGRTQTTTLDVYDRVTAVEVPGLEPVHYLYENVGTASGEYGRLLSVIQGDPLSADARRWDYRYQQDSSIAGYGFLQSVTSPWTDPVSALRDHAVSYRYDSALRIDSKTLSDGQEIDFSWDKNSNLSALTPPGRSAHRFGVDEANLPENYWPPTLTPGEADNTYETDYAYNEDYLLEKITHPGGDVIDYVYVPQTSRIDSMTVGSETIDYGYDAQTGQLESIDLQHSGVSVQALTHTWDGPLLMSVTESGDVAGSVEFTYDDHFRVASLSVNGANQVSYTYSPDGQLGTAGQMTLGYFSTHGLLQSATLADTVASYTYNTFGEPQTYTVTDMSRGETLFDVDYIRDKLGRITTLIETTDGQTQNLKYEYDRRGRLVEVLERNAVGAYNTIESYGWDANGNRISADNAFDTLSPGDIDVDAQDRLIRYGDLAFTYTADGMLFMKTDTVSDEVSTYDYDALGNLRSVELPDTRRIEYIVDGAQRRVGRRVFDAGGTLTDEVHWLYQDALNPVAELDAQGRVLKRFVYGSKGHIPDYMVTYDVSGVETGSYRLVTDQLGSVRLVVDLSDGTVVQRMTYDTFGNVLDDTNEGFQPFGFAGGLYDAQTGLVRFGARDYDARVGRWTAKDPIGFGGGDTDLYAYVAGDPVNFIDPTGRSFIVVGGGIIIAAGLVYLYHQYDQTQRHKDYKGSAKDNKLVKAYESDLRAFAYNREPMQNECFQVFGHGDYFTNVITTERLVKEMKAGGYDADNHQCIELVACGTKDWQAAQHLANQTGASVMAPTDLISYTPTGIQARFWVDWQEYTPK